MITIIDPQEKIVPYYFSETMQNHYVAIQDYIQNKSIHFSLKYDLQLADRKRKEIVQTAGQIRPIPNKIIYRNLPVYFYDKIAVDNYDTNKLGNFDQVIATLLETRAFYDPQSERSPEENTHKR